ncbi:XRE family transcriptional regulator [Salmonella enterica]|nr:XRE family transcriptional regulator [Salmonella enterica]EDG9409548.1 helix-turn-helix domain-containing protein [Salmonella enterica subsp. enterica serovar Tennessee]EGU4607811.1 helix-turn-helix transcriptional regulator [Salmonella enterica]ELD6314400.1 helix-turn-helix transcriptional regulator [Salmonella enterica]
MDRTFSNERIERFGERLKAAMKGMSNSELARRSGISEGAIRKYITGESYPAINNAMKVADACNVPLPWLLLGDDCSLSPSDRISKNSTTTTDKATSMFVCLLSMVSEQDRNALAIAASEIGIKGILSKLQQADTVTVAPEREYTREEQEAMLRALPISERAKNTASLVLALGDDAQKEIFEILEDFKRRIAPEGNVDNPTVTPDPSLKQKAG